MPIFVLIIAGIFALDVIWAIASVRLSRGLPHRSWWLALSLLFVGAQLAGLATVVLSRAFRANWDRSLPRSVVSGVLLWHLLGLGLLLIGLPLGLVWGLARCSRRRLSPAQPAERELPVPVSPAAPAPISRGQFLKMTALATPPLFTVFLSTITQAQLRHFRVRRFILPMAGLPRDLDGMTIAHVSDMHLGRLTSAPVLRAMVKTVNDLRTDLVLLTGDLINDELTDLTEGLVLASALQGRYGHCMIEGNHDLLESRSVFETRARNSPVPFLVDETLTVPVRGYPVQLLGLRWEAGGGGRDEVIARSARPLLAQRQPDTFPILLAHHPHAFDTAAEMDIPLTLSGHTHGGQRMLSENVGVGPVLYRYWSGHYQRNRSQLIVSNGVGNWFPLRIDAPAEIVHLTLRRV